MTKKELYEIAEEAWVLQTFNAAAEFERKECEKICSGFSMKDKRIEVEVRAADLIRLRNNSDVALPLSKTPKDFITYIED